MFILVITLYGIVLLFENEDKFLDKEFVELKGKVNVSNGEYIAKCYNGSYVIVRHTDIFICGEINQNNKFKINTKLYKEVS